jgi:hypothetical protein
MRTLKLFQSFLKEVSQLFQDRDFLVIILDSKQLFNRILAKIGPIIQPEEQDQLHIKPVDLDLKLSPQGEPFFLKFLSSVWVMHQ